jgi:Protein of unknown function (DUF2523).
MPLVTWLIGMAWPIVRKVLVELGISFITYEGVSAALDSLLSSAQASYQAGPSVVLAYLAIAGVPTGFGIIAGALSARVARFATKKFILK